MHIVTMATTMIVVSTPLPFSLAELSKLSAVLRDVMVTIAMGKHLPNAMIHKATSHDPSTTPMSLDWACLLTVRVWLSCDIT